VPSFRIIVSLSLCLPFTLPVLAQTDDKSFEEIVITSVRDTSELRTDDTLVAPPDTAQLLRLMPGANVNKNGALTGIAQYRGMYGDRVNVSVNGAHISSGGPNAMDAPLHYAPVALLESLTVHRGIAPVSAGQETEGGSMEARTWQGDFGNSDAFSSHGRVYSGAQSAYPGYVVGAILTTANDSHLLRASVMTEKADDSEFPGGKLLPTEYDRDRFDLGYSFQDSHQRFDINVAVNNTGDAGTPALPMDIQSIDSKLLQMDHHWEGARYTLSTAFSYNSIDHWMTNYHLRVPPQDNQITPGAIRYRATFASSDNYGFKVMLEQELDNGTRRFGIDGHFSDHDADISNPNAAMFAISNFNGVERNILGLFAEQETNIGTSVGLKTGVRVNRVSMSSGRVSANLNPMNATAGMPFLMNAMAASIGDSFNAGQLDQDDTNLDLFARLSMEQSNRLTWYLGAARKTRSPSFQERYLWLPLESTGGLADGITYVGNVNLDPEVSLEMEAGFDYTSRGLTVYPRVFVKKVNDYIQGTPATDVRVNQFAQMMANMGMGTPNPLQFNNTDARLYGLDVESRLRLNERLSLQANLSMVRGERRDIDDNLYRIAPDNLLLALVWTANTWTGSLESVFYAGQDRVSVTNREQETGGYALLNLSTRIYPAENLELGLGVNNLFDREYRDHLAGYNRAVNPDIPLRERLPGLGRNLYGRLIYQF